MASGDTPGRLPDGDRRRSPPRLGTGGSARFWLPVLLAAAVPAHAASPGPAPSAWPDDAASRLAALALVETLDADLLSHDSATLTLDRWCAAHRLAEPALVTARRVPEAETPADDAVRERLGVGAAEPIRHRHVRLACGTRVLSEADNFYLPARLTPEMNRVLDTTDTPFGRAVGALKFQRRTLSSQLLWNPLPPGWEMGSSLPPAGPGTLIVPAQVLRHHAVLMLPDGTPFSALTETYTGAVLDFPAPPMPR